VLLNEEADRTITIHPCLVVVSFLISKVDENILKFLFVLTKSV